MRTWGRRRRGGCVLGGRRGPDRRGAADARRRGASPGERHRCLSVGCFFELTTTLCYSISHPIPVSTRLDSPARTKINFGYPLCRCKLLPRALLCIFNRRPAPLGAVSLYPLSRSSVRSFVIARSVCASACSRRSLLRPASPRSPSLLAIC